MTSRARKTLAALTHLSQVRTVCQTGMRSESMDYVRAHVDALPLPVVAIYPDGEAVVVDGRHRLAVRREQGRKFVDVEVVVYNRGCDVVVRTERRLVAA